MATGITKGKWEVIKAGYFREIVGNRSMHRGECDCVTSIATVIGNATSQEVTEANARAIAALPTILDAATELLKEWDEADDVGMEKIGRLRAALSAATGASK